jgi:uncharacterized OB-fold protein
MPACPNCGSGPVSWEAASGRARVHSYTVVHHAAHPDFAERVPYVAAVVELEEGPRVVANIVDCPIEDVAVEMAVRATFVEVAAGIVLPQFAPADQRP